MSDFCQINLLKFNSSPKSRDVSRQKWRQVEND